VQYGCASTSTTHSDGIRNPLRLTALIPNLKKNNA
jgi:hypothetical protein